MITQKRELEILDLLNWEEDSLNLKNSWDTFELLSIGPAQMRVEEPAHPCMSRHSFSDFNQKEKKGLIDSTRAVLPHLLSEPPRGSQSWRHL
jgi:hypothetical protein